MSAVPIPIAYTTVATYCSGMVDQKSRSHMLIASGTIVAGTFAIMYSAIELLFGVGVAAVVIVPSLSAIVLGFAFRCVGGCRSNWRWIAGIGVALAVIAGAFGLWIILLSHMAMPGG